MRWLYSSALKAAFLFILGAPIKLAQYTAATVSLAILFAGFSAQQNQLAVNSQPIGIDFAGQYVRNELPDVPGNEVYVVGSDEQLVEASIFWMDRPGVQFQLYNSRISLPDSQIPSRKSVIGQVLVVVLEQIQDQDKRETDLLISYRKN